MKLKNMLKKINLKYVLHSIGAIILFVLGLSFITPLPIFTIKNNSELISRVDFSDSEKMVGYHHNVFVAKVNKFIKTESIEKQLISSFEVEILKNIKGKAPEKITVYQSGGYRSIVKIEDGAELLKEGNIYLLATGGDSEHRYSLLNHPNTIIKIADKNDYEREIKNNTLNQFINKNKTVIEMENAYKNEKYFWVDLKNNTLKNTYKEISKEERQKLYDKHFEGSREKIEKYYIKNYKADGISFTDAELDKIVDLELKYSGFGEEVKPLSANKHRIDKAEIYREIEKLDNEIYSRKKDK